MITLFLCSLCGGLVGSGLVAALLNKTINKRFEERDAKITELAKVADNNARNMRDLRRGINMIGLEEWGR